MAKYFLTLATLLISLGANGAIVTGNFQNNLGSNYNGTLVVSNTVNAQVIGTNINVGKSVTIQLVNGAFTNNLLTGSYSGNAAGYPIRFNVPNDSSATVYRLEDLSTNLITFTYTNRGVFAIAPGTNATATTNNGLVTISTSGGSLANATNNDTVVSNGVISAVYASQLVPTNAVYPNGSFTTYTLTGLTVGRSYFLYFDPNGNDADVINGAEDLTFSTVFVAQGTSIDMFCASSDGTTRVKHRVFPLSGNFYGTFTGNFAGDVVNASQNGLDFADIDQTRANLHAVVTDNVSGSLNLQDSFVTLGYGSYGASGSSDTTFHVRNGATSRLNSGASFCADVMGVNPTTGKAVLIDPVGFQFIDVPTNKTYNIWPAYGAVVCNPNTSMKGVMIGGTGLSGLDSLLGNCAMFCADFGNKLSRFPVWQPGIYSPDDLLYTFTVTGVSVTPLPGDLYTNNSRVWEVISTSISGGSGTISATSRGAPTASGTLGVLTEFGNRYGNGSASISFSAAVLSHVWVDAFSVNPVTGLTTVGSNLTVSGSATFNSTITGNGSGLTSIPESGVTSLVADLATKAPLASPTFTGTITGNGSGITSIPESGVTSLTTDLAAKAPLASPTFTGTITGNGSGLTALNGANLTSGTVNSNALDTLTKAQLALAGGGGPTLAASQTWTGSNTFASIAVTGQALNTNASTGNYIVATNGSLTISNASTGAYIIATNNEVQSQHFGGIKVGSGPAIASVGTGAGTGGTADFTADDNPNDSWMRIKVVTGTTPAAGAIICSVTYSKAWPTKPKAIGRLNLKNAGTGPNSVVIDDSTISTTGFDVVSGGLALTASTTYYITVQSGR